jgi:hypothetical protein
VDVDQVLDDKFVGMDGTGYGQMSAGTGKNERWTTGFIEKSTELRAVLETRHGM